MSRPFRFPYQNFVGYLIAHMRATCPVYKSFFRKFDDEYVYKLRGSSVFSLIRFLSLPFF